MTTMEVVRINVRLARGYEVPKTSDPDPWAERNPAEGEGCEHQPGRLEDPRRPISRGQIRQAALRAGPRRIRRGGGLRHGNNGAPEGRRNLCDARLRSRSLCRDVIVKTNEAAPKPRSINHLAAA